MVASGKPGGGTDGGHSGSGLHGGQTAGVVHGAGSSMTTELPDGLQKFFKVTLGMEWPEASEGGLREMARAWLTFQEDLEARVEEIALIIPLLERGMRGDVAKVNIEYLTQLEDQFTDGAEAAAAFADTCRTTAADVQKGKVMLIAMAILIYTMLIHLMATIIGALASGAFLAGAQVVLRSIFNAMLGRVTAAAAAQAAKQVGLQLMKVMGRMAWNAAKYAVAGAAFMGTLDGSIQLGQMAEGAIKNDGVSGRARFDWDSFKNSVIGGAIGGAAFGAFHGVAKGVANLGRNMRVYNPKTRKMEMPGAVRALGHFGYATGGAASVVASNPLVGKATGHEEEIWNGMLGGMSRFHFSTGIFAKLDDAVTGIGENVGKKMGMRFGVPEHLLDELNPGEQSEPLLGDGKGDEGGRTHDPDGHSVFDESAPPVIPASVLDSTGGFTGHRGTGDHGTPIEGMGSLFNETYGDNPVTTSRGDGFDSLGDGHGQSFGRGFDDDFEDTFTEGGRPISVISDGHADGFLAGPPRVPADTAGLSGGQPPSVTDGHAGGPNGTLIRTESGPPPVTQQPGPQATTQPPSTTGGSRQDAPIRTESGSQPGASQPGPSRVDGPEHVPNTVDAPAPKIDLPTEGPGRGAPSPETAPPAGDRPKSTLDTSFANYSPLASPADPSPSPVSPLAEPERSVGPAGPAGPITSAPPAALTPPPTPVPNTGPSAVLTGGQPPGAAGPTRADAPLPGPDPTAAARERLATLIGKPVARMLPDVPADRPATQSPDRPAPTVPARLAPEAGPASLDSAPPGGGRPKLSVDTSFANAHRSDGPVSPLTDVERARVPSDPVSPVSPIIPVAPPLPAGAPTNHGTGGLPRHTTAPITNPGPATPVPSHSTPAPPPPVTAAPRADLASAGTQPVPVRTDGPPTGPAADKATQDRLADLLNKPITQSLPDRPTPSGPDRPAPADRPAPEKTVAQAPDRSASAPDRPAVQSPDRPAPSERPAAAPDKAVAQVGSLDVDGALRMPAGSVLSGGSFRSPGDELAYFDARYGDLRGIDRAPEADNCLEVTVQASFSIMEGGAFLAGSSGPGRLDFVNGLVGTSFRAVSPQQIVEHMRGERSGAQGLVYLGSDGGLGHYILVHKDSRGVVNFVDVKNASMGVLDTDRPVIGFVPLPWTGATELNAGPVMPPGLVGGAPARQRGQMQPGGRSGAAAPARVDPTAARAAAVAMEAAAAREATAARVDPTAARAAAAAMVAAEARAAAAAVAPALRAAAATRTNAGRLNADAVADLFRVLPRLPDDSQASIRALVKGVFPGDVKLEPIGGRARTTRPVYRAVVDGKPVGFVKVVPNRNEFAEELSAAARLHQANLTGFRVPKVLAVAAVLGPDRKTRGALFSELAPGESIDSLLRRVPMAWDRAHAMGDLSRAVTLVAEGMAELHGHDRGVRDASEKYLSKHAKDIRDHLDQLETRRDTLERHGIDLDQIRTAMDSTIADAMTDPGPASLTHGDAHLGNFLWDPNAGVSVIDAPTLHHSMDAAGAPIGTPARDVALFTQRIGHFGFEFGLTSEQIAQLRQDFADAYARKGGPVVPAPVRAMFDARVAAYRLARAVNRLEKRPNSHSAPDVGAAAAALQEALGLDNSAATRLANSFAGQLPGTPEFRRAWNAIDNFRSYMLNIADPKTRDRFEREYGSRIRELQSSQTGKFKELWKKNFPHRDAESALSPDNSRRAEAVIRALAANAEELRADLARFAATTGDPALTEGNLGSTMDRQGAAAWEASFRETRDKIDEVIAKFTYRGHEIGYIGSMTSGRRGPHKGKTRFDPYDFDVDLYVVVDRETFNWIRNEYPELDPDDTKIMPSGRNPPDIVRLGKAIGQALKEKFPEVRGIEESVIAIRAERPW